MAADKNQKISKLTERFAPEFRDLLEELLSDKEIVPKKEFARLTGLLVDAFDETLAEHPNEKRMDRKLRELILGLLNIQYEGNIEDEMLRRATKIIREKIVRKGEREKLARLLTKEVMEGWLTMDEELIEHVAGFDGLLERLQDKAEGKLDFSDSELIDIMLELGTILCARYMERLESDELDEILERSINVCKHIEEDRKAGDPLLSLVQYGMQHLGFVALMRRAFAGLLLSDLIIRQIGKSLGIKEKVSVTDFIIFVGVKVFETEQLKEVEKERVVRTRKIFEEVKKL